MDYRQQEGSREQEWRESLETERRNSMKDIAAALVQAQRERHTPEGRMAEAALLKQLRWHSKDRIFGGTVADRLFRSLMFGGNECWYWVGSISRLGYGQFPALGESKAHRVSFRLFKGDIPPGLHVLHTCDTRCCVNPDHLRLGTHAENMRDMANKGRVKVVRKFGEANPMAKLTVSAVQEIRHAKAAGEAQKSIAARFGVSPMAISRVVRGRSWT